MGQWGQLEGFGEMFDAAGVVNFNFVSLIREVLLSLSSSSLIGHKPLKAL